MSTSGPWVSADNAIHSGDIWNAQLITFAISGGGNLSTTGIKRASSTVAMGGGGAIVGTAVRQASAITADSGYGQGSYGASTYGPGITITGGGATTGAGGFTSAFSITGGGNANATGRRGAASSPSLPGGGAVAARTIKRGFAVTAEGTYGQGQYGSATYGPGVLVHGGGTAAGAGGFEVSVILSGGGTAAATATKYTHAVVPGCTYGQSTYGSSFYGAYIPLIGGGNLSIVPDPRRYTGVAISSGGGVLVVGHKAALASNVENCYGQVVYGVGVYSTALHLHGGGAISAAGIKRAQVALVASTGGTLVISAVKTAYTTTVIHGGGVPTGQGIKHAFSHSAGDGYGVAIYGVATYSSLPGVYGAAAYGVATYSPTYNSYGVAVYGAATYGATDTSILHIHGGGRLYGPFPYVLSPRVRVVNGQGLVHILTGQAGVKVNTSSVRLTVPA